MSRTNLGGDQITDQTITNADVSASAAIDGSKIYPDFGTQDLITTGSANLRAEAEPALSASGTGRIYFDSTSNRFRMSESGGAYTDLLGGGVAGTGAAGRVSFWIGTTTLSSSTAFYWDEPNTRLGVGTASPTNTLSVSGSADISGTLDLTGMLTVGVGTTISPSGVLTLEAGGKLTTEAGNNLEVQIPTTREFHLTTSLAESRIAVDSSGRVGLGSATPALRLSVHSGLNGAPETSGTTQTNGTARLKGSDSGILDFGIYTGGAGTWLQSTDSTNLGTPYPILLNPNGGEVGIGNATPESNLDVSISSSRWARFGSSAWSTRLGQLADGKQWIATGVNKTAADSLYKAFTGNNAAVNHLIMEMNFANTNGGFNFYGQTHVADGTTLTPTTILHLDVDGGVGIGNQSPDSILHTQGTLSTAYDATVAAPGQIGVNTIKVKNLDTAVNSFAQISLEISGSSGPSLARIVAIKPAAAQSDLAFVLRDGSVHYEAVRFQGLTGNVGIGTSAPDSSSKIDVVGAVRGKQFTDVVNAFGNSGASPSIDWSLGAVQTVTLTANCTFSFTGGVTGQTVTLFLNTGAGSFTAAWPGTVKWPGGTTPTVTTTASKTDIFTFYYDGTNFWGFTGGQNY